jgi:DNA-binding NarL/FixJ family response regulator
VSAAAVPIRVLIADDHALVRTGLEGLLGSAQDIEVVGSAESGPQAVEVALAERPDVVLMDLSMPGGGGIAATRSITQQAPSIKVAVLTSFSDRERILEAVDAGAVGYLLKDAEPDELLHGVRAAARGEAPFAPKAALALVRERSAGKTRPALTSREGEVLALVAEGLPNKRIARRLEISEKTVKAHLTNAFQAIGVTDRTQAAIWVNEHGIPTGRAR